MALGTAAGVRERTVPELSPDAVFAALHTSPRGLSSAEAAVRLAAQGRYELPGAPGRSPVIRFLGQFTDLFAVLLLVAAGFTLLAYLLGNPRDAGNLRLAVAIVAVVLLNAVIGFGQEYVAERTADALRAMVPHRARVIRDGERVEVPAAELVAGDVVVLDAGDAVSADCRVVEAFELAVNNVALTGESDPAGRDAEPQVGIPRLEARNLVWMGTTVSSGTGKAVVTGTGAATEFGRIYRLTAITAPEPQPPAAADREHGPAGRRGGLRPGGAAVRGSVAGRRPDRADVRVRARGDGGLRAGGTAGHAVGGAGDRGAAETLGSTTVICTDKTGTLTKAEMTVQQVWSGQPAGPTG